MRSVAFLSRLPVAARYFDQGDEKAADLRADVAAFPLAGVVIAAGPCLLLIVMATAGGSDLIVAGFTVLALVAVCGALHEDGLADVADGFGGASQRERRLEIMKDSRVGSYGVIALCGSLLLRVAALAAILAQHGAPAAAIALLAVAAASRAAMVWLWAELPDALDKGLAASIGKPADGTVTFASICGLVLFAVGGVVATGFFSTLVALLLAVLAARLFARLCRRMIGGVTGDTLGACQQIVEISLLTGLALGFSVPT